MTFANERLGILQNYDREGNGGRLIDYVSKANNSARASGFYVNFFGVPGRTTIRHEMTKF